MCRSSESELGSSCSSSSSCLEPGLLQEFCRSLGLEEHLNRADLGLEEQLTRADLGLEEHLNRADLGLEEQLTRPRRNGSSQPKVVGQVGSTFN